MQLLGSVDQEDDMLRVRLVANLVSRELPAFNIALVTVYSAVCLSPHLDTDTSASWIARDMSGLSGSERTAKPRLT